MPRARTDPASCVVYGKIYALGLGVDGTAVDMVKYDPATDTWTRAADAPRRRALCTGVVDGKIYAIGGCPRPGPINRSSIVEEYDIGPAPPRTPKSVNPAGKLVTMWGRLKAR